MRKIRHHFASPAWLNATAFVRSLSLSLSFSVSLPHPLSLSSCMIPFDIFKVLSSFCQADFTVINTSAPSASLFDCLLLYVKRKCQSNFLPAYLHDNEAETNRWQLAKITGAPLPCFTLLLRSGGGNGARWRLCFHVCGYQKEGGRGLWQREMPEGDCVDSQLN